MTIFAAKLDDAARTIELVLSQKSHSLAKAIASTRGTSVIAVGSGGSCISAEYLATCRDTLGSSTTFVQTPMQLCLADSSLAGTAVFLFSASGNNADIIAAHTSAVARGAAPLHLVTNNPAGTLARICTDRGDKVHALPTADPKDGFLATHSLIGTVTALLAASDAVAHRSAGPSAKLVEDFSCAADLILSRQARREMAEALASVKQSDTILLLHDPRLAAIAQLIETSVWETALCNLQRTDHRNFAHGRHVWLHHRPLQTFVLSIAGPESAAVWKSMEQEIPAEIRRLALDLPNCGRLENAIGILRGLTIIEALGKAVSIDPAKPGAGPFAGALYDSDSLRGVANVLPEPVRHKRRAMARTDLPDACNLSLVESFESLKARLRKATFRGLVLDYDGTIVTNEGRFDPPEKPVLDELERLLEQGMRIAIATGRGGSAGESLREKLPVKFHRDILVGYYNGGDIRSLDIDLRDSPLPKAQEIEVVEQWLRANKALLITSPKVRPSPVQIAIDVSSIESFEAFQRAFDERFATSTSIRISHSAHTVDIYLASSCKTNVFRRLAEDSGTAADEILCIGDSGDASGNDYALLGMPFGLSVDQVCCRTDAGWALLGAFVKGPTALLLILQALHKRPDGGFKMDVDRL